jgi:phosphoribosyl-AMP cyclohydrolase
VVTFNLVDIKNDCDGDTIDPKVKPVGPTCHTGADGKPKTKQSMVSYLI